MNTSSYTFHKLLVFTALMLPSVYLAQTTYSDSLNMDAVYNRPLQFGNARLAVGGYLEANSYYSSEDGVTEGLSFQARRLTMFMSGNITNRIKFMSELEFEEGGHEINIEFAAMDIALHSALNFRGGVVMNPIGAFNQNHDGPKWEFIERPDMAVNILPATWSNAGMGIFGKVRTGDCVFGYEAYLTNGFDNSIIDNEEGRTFLPSAKEDGERFEENNSGKAMLTGKLALKNHNIGEIGLSYMGGVYNKHETDGVVLDDPRRVDVVAIDIRTQFPPLGTQIIAEVARVLVDVPDSYTQQFGSEQLGVFVDVIQPIYNGDVLDWDNCVVNLAARVDYVDWNIGSFNDVEFEEGTEIGDELLAITPAFSFRPNSDTVIRLNYRYQWQKDILNNPAALMAAWMFGFSTYF